MEWKAVKIPEMQHRGYVADQEGTPITYLMDIEHAKLIASAPQQQALIDELKKMLYRLRVNLSSLSTKTEDEMDILIAKAGGAQEIDDEEIEKEVSE